MNKEQKLAFKPLKEKIKASVKYYESLRGDFEYCEKHSNFELAVTENLRDVVTDAITQHEWEEAAIAMVTLHLRKLP
jgi:hypothetical protein